MSDKNKNWLITNKKLNISIAAALLLVAGFFIWYPAFFQKSGGGFYDRLSEADKECIISETSEAFLNRFKKTGTFDAQDAENIKKVFECIDRK